MSDSPPKAKFFSDWVRNQCYLWTAVAAGLPDAQNGTKVFMNEQQKQWWAEAKAWDELFKDNQ